VTRTQADSWAMTTTWTGPWPVAGNVRTKVSSATGTSVAGPLEDLVTVGVTVVSSGVEPRIFKMEGAVG
jgi:hypothetical protein